MANLLNLTDTVSVPGKRAWQAPKLTHVECVVLRSAHLDLVVEHLVPVGAVAPTDTACAQKNKDQCSDEF